MATQIDRLQTVIIATGQSTYRRAMATSALATKALGMANTQAAAADVAHTATARAATATVAGQAAGSVAAATAALAMATADVEVARTTVIANLTSVNLTAALAALTAAETAAAVAGVELAAAEGAAAAGGAGLTAAIGPLMAAIGPLTIAATAAGAAIMVVSAAAVVVGGAGAGGLIAATKAAKDFEAVMKDVELQSGATADEMDRIVESALSIEMTAMGKSGTQAANVYKRLASEGFGVAEMEKMRLPIMRAVINLGEDEGEVTKLMLNLMEQYNLEASDMVMISDSLTNALAGTSYQGDELVEVMRYAGPAASSLGWSLQETIAVTDALQKRFGVASMSGTRFVQVVNALRDPSGEMADELERVGISLDDVAESIETPTGLYVLLGTAMERGANFAKMFQARALSAAEILAKESIPRMQELTAEMHKSGTAVDFTIQKMGTLAGSLEQINAAWESLKISVGLFTQALGTDWVMGATMALEATVEFTRVLRNLSETQNLTAAQMIQNQRDIAETFITTAAMIARSLAIAGFALKNFGEGLMDNKLLTALWGASALGMIEKVTTALAKRAGKKALEAGKEEAASALAEIDKWEAGILKALDTVQAKRLEMARPTGGGGAGPAARDEVVPGKTREQMQAEFAKETAGWLKQMVGYRKELAWFAASDNILADDAIQKALIELDYRDQDLATAEMVLAVLVKRGAEEDDRAAAADDVNQATLDYMRAEVGYAKELADLSEEYKDNVDKATRGWIAGHLAMAQTAKNLAMQAYWHRQIILYLHQQATVAAQANDWETWGKLQKEMARSQEELFKLGDRERMKTARDYDRLIKKGDSVRDAIQAVIGGTLGRGISEAIGRVSGAGLRQGVGAGAVRAAGTNEIRVVVEMSGLSDEGKRQITDHFIGVLEEGATRLPALAN